VVRIERAVEEARITILDAIQRQVLSGSIPTTPSPGSGAAAIGFPGTPPEMRVTPRMKYESPMLRQLLERTRPNLVKVEEALKGGANPDTIIEIKGMRLTSLHRAAFFGDEQLLRMLLAFGADPHLHTGAVRPVLGAIRGGHQECAVLIANKMNKESLSSPAIGLFEGHTALFQAVLLNMPRVVMAILEKGVDPNALILPVPLGHSQSEFEYKPTYPELKTTVMHVWTDTAHARSDEPSLTILKLLLAYGGNAGLLDEAKITPLERATELKMTAAVDLMAKQLRRASQSVDIVQQKDSPYTGYGWQPYSTPL
jgi:hypothetical protein